MFLIFQPIYLTQLGANPQTIGMILGASGFAMMIAHIPAGYLADKIGRKPVLISAWVSGVLATWIMALSPNLNFFIAGVLLYGFTAFVSSPLNSYLTAARGSWSVGRAITTISAMFSLGSIIGPFSGGWIGSHFGLKSIYFISGSLFLLSTLLLFMIKPQPREQHDPSIPRLDLLKNKQFLRFLALSLAAVFAMVIAQPFTPKYLQEVRILSISDVGFLGTIGGIGTTIFSFTLGLFQANAGFLLGQLSMGFSSILFWKANGYGWLMTAYFLSGGFRASRSLIMALVRPYVPTSQIGLAYGITEAVLSLAGILAPISAGFLYEINPALMYPVSIIAIFLCVFLSVNLHFQEQKSRLQTKIEFLD